MLVRGPHPTRRLRSSRTRSATARSDELEALRQLVVGPERRRLDEVERSSPEAIGNLLPEAIAHAENKRGDDLAMTFEKPVTAAVGQIARREPTFFGELLAPTIGTAVRRAVADALAALVQRINQLVDTRFSLRSARWRFEARRTGRPYAEIVLAHTLIYRVEWAVLIDVPTSLVIAEASPPDGVNHAPDQTAAMLAAISSFVSEAVQPTSPGALVHAIEVGDLRLWIERDRTFAVAIAIRGVAPLTLREQLRTTLDQVHTLHRERATVIETTAYADTQPLLIDLLTQEVRRPPNRAKWILPLIAGAVLTGIALLIARHAADDSNDARLRAAYRNTLSATPGVVVMAVERAEDRHVIRGLRDPRATPPEFIIAAAGLPPATLDLAPYESRDPQFADPMQVVAEAVHALESVEIEFARGGVEPADPDAVARAADLAVRLQREAVNASTSVCLDVIGDSDETGSELRNAPLRQARASGIANALALAGVSDKSLIPRPADPARTRERARRVTFHAALRPTWAAGGCR